MREFAKSVDKQLPLCRIEISDSNGLGRLQVGQDRGAELCRERDVKHRTAGLNPPFPRAGR